jgi:6-pyruvoyltetrahydropterin/6-carboxytetrahydropterin synthase
VIGKIINNPENPKYGMVMDYSDLKKIVEKEIVKQFDHALVLNVNSPHQTFAYENMLGGNIILVPYQPTCENLLLDFAERISKALPQTIKLHHLKLKETPMSYAEWFAEDQWT